MNDKLSLEKMNNLTSEACAWIAQLESESMKSDDLAAFKEWVERSPAHKKEIKRLALFSSELNVITEMAAPLKAAADHRRKFSILDKTFFRPKIQYFVGVFCLITVFFFADYINQDNGVSVNEPLLYATDIGSHREIRLSDGTLLNLNTNSVIEIDFSIKRRKVRLLKGEAFFQVAHNANRPFIVYAGEKSVRAVGTAFVVRNTQNKFEVIVTEGKIELSQTVSNILSTGENETLLLASVIKEREVLILPKASVFLNAGQMVVYNKSDQKHQIEKLVKPVSKQEIKRKLSWQDGLLDFSETPLIDVINDLSRYTSMKIEILDPELRNLKFGGLFRTNELQALFNALETNFDIKIERISDKHVRISRNEPVGDRI